MRNTTGIRPVGAGTASSRLQRAGRGRAADLLGLHVVEELEAHRAARRLVAGLHAGVAGRDALHHHARAHVVVVGEQAVGVGDEDAAVRVGVGSGDRGDRAALLAGGGVGLLQQLDLAGLLDGFGRDDVVDAFADRSRLVVQRGGAHTAATATGRGRGRFTRGAETLGRQIRRVREAGGVAAHDADAGAAIAARHELLDATVVEAGARRPPILHEHLGEVAATAQRVLDRGLQDTLDRSARACAARLFGRLRVAEGAQVTPVCLS